MIKIALLRVKNPVITGGTLYPFYLFKALQDLSRKKNDISVEEISINISILYSLPRGIRVPLELLIREFFLNFLFLYLTLTKRYSIIIHTDPIILPSLHSTKRIFLVFHPKIEDFYILGRHLSLLGRISLRLQVLLEMLSASTSWLTVTISPLSVKRITETYRIPKNRVTYIWGGIEKEIFKPPSMVPPSERYILAPHVLRNERKGGSFFINLLKLLAKSSIKHKLNIIVTGPIDKRYRKEIEKLRKDLRIFLIGNIPREKLPILYYNALCTLIPSKFEGLGLVALECMSSGGIPIVSNFVPASYFVKKVGGFVLPLKEKTWVSAIEKLLNKPLERKRLRYKILRGRKLIYSWTDVAKKLVKEIKRRYKSHCYPNNC